MESVTLWNCNKIESWINSKEQSDKTDIIEKARNLSKRLALIATKHKASYKQAREDAFKEEAETRREAIQIGNKHQNLMKKHQKDVVPRNVESFEKCRTTFNTLANNSPNDQKQFLSALTRYLNNNLGTQLKAPQDRGASIGSVTIDVKKVISTTAIDKI